MCSFYTYRSVSDGDHRLYPRITGSQLITTFPPSRCPISRLSSLFCINNALTSATPVSAGYLPNTSLSFLYSYEITPKRTVTSVSSNNRSPRTSLPRSASPPLIHPSPPPAPPTLFPTFHTPPL